MILAALGGFIVGTWFGFFIVALLSMNKSKEE